MLRLRDLIKVKPVECEAKIIRGSCCWKRGELIYSEADVVIVRKVCLICSVFVK